jgi:hypothetical protein
MATNNASKTSLAGVSDLVSSSPPSLCSVPNLSKSLNLSYGVLNDDMKRLFNRVYVYLWGVVNARSVRALGFVPHYWLMVRLSASSSLSPSAFTVLTYLYMMSDKGRYYIHSANVVNSGVLPGALSITVGRVLWDLKHAGMITRHTKDPSRPYEQRAQHNRNTVFIHVTNKGVQFIEDTEKQFSRVLLNTSFNDLIGANKNPAD